MGAEVNNLHIYSPLLARPVGSAQARQPVLSSAGCPRYPRALAILQQTSHCVAVFTNEKYYSLYRMRIHIAILIGLTGIWGSVGDCSANIAMDEDCLQGHQGQDGDELHVQGKRRAIPSVA